MCEALREIDDTQIDHPPRILALGVEPGFQVARPGAETLAPALEELLNPGLDLAHGEVVLVARSAGVALPLMTSSTTAALRPAVHRWISSSIPPVSPAPFTPFLVAMSTSRPHC